MTYRTSMLIFALVTMLGSVLVTGCGSDEAPIPEAEELFGAWENQDSGTTRAFVFAASDDTYDDLAGASMVYRLYLHGTGEDPIMVQRGTYAITSGALVTTLTWSSDTTMGSPGVSYANDILDWFGDGFTLQSDSAANGERVFQAVDGASYQ